MDWRDLAADPEVQAVSIAAPNFLHREIGVAMAQAGKHIWIEKPVGLSTADATRGRRRGQRRGRAERRSGSTTAMRRLSQRARELIAVRRPRHDHPRPVPAVQRLRGAPRRRAELAVRAGARRQRRAGRPRLARRRPGPVPAGRHRCLVADTATFLTERARPTGATSGHGRATGGELGPVENEDFVVRLLRFASGARGTLEASRVAVGEQNNYGFEIHGTKGAVFWDFRRMGELGVGYGTAYQDQSLSTVFVGPGHGDYGAFQPGSATSMGYDDLKVIEAYNFLRSIEDGQPHGQHHRRRGPQRGSARRDGRVGGLRSRVPGCPCDDGAGGRHRRRASWAPITSPPWTARCPVRWSAMAADVDADRAAAAPTASPGKSDR